MPGDFESVLSGHIDIQQRDLRLQGFGQLNGFDAVGCLAAHFEAGVRFNYLLEASAKDRVVVGDGDADLGSLIGVHYSICSGSRRGGSLSHASNSKGQAGSLSYIRSSLTAI